MYGSKQKMISEICNAQSIGKSIQLYGLFYKYLEGYEFIFANDKGATPGLSVNKDFSCGTAIRSLFNTPHVVILNPFIYEEMFLKHKNVTFPIDYSISLDSQAFSYLKPFIEGRVTRLPADYREVFDFISQQHVNVDPFMYKMENYNNLKDPKNRKEIFSRVRAYEILRNLDVELYQTKTIIKSKISDEELDIKAEKFIEKMHYDLRNDDFVRFLSIDYGRLYVYILEMCIIQMKSPKKSLENKLIELLKFSHNQANFFGVREILIAKRYFDKGNSEPFFSKVQINNSDFWNHVRGMAWDLRHQRFLEYAITLRVEDDSEYFFPSILTCDKRFINILDANSVKVIVFNRKTNEILPFYNIDFKKEVCSCGSKVESLLEFLSSEDKVNERSMHQRSGGTFELLISTLEEELENISGHKLSL